MFNIVQKKEVKHPTTLYSEHDQLCRVSDKVRTPLLPPQYLGMCAVISMLIGLIAISAFVLAFRRKDLPIMLTPIITSGLQCE